MDDPLPAFDDAYDDLRRVAHALVLRRAPNATLNATALVHEAFLRLGGHPAHDRAHLLALAARAMRFVLVDHARARTSAKRGGFRVTLDEATLPHLADVRADEVLALDAALTRLSAEHPRLGTVVELRFFGGMTLAEAGVAMGVSERTAKRDWALARAWLHRALHGDVPVG